MEILSEKEQTFVNMELDLTPEETKNLIEYADANISVKTLNDLKIEWAFVNILESQINDLEVKT